MNFFKATLFGIFGIIGGIGVSGSIGSIIAAIATGQPSILFMLIAFLPLTLGLKPGITYLKTLKEKKLQEAKELEEKKIREYKKFKKQQLREAEKKLQKAKKLKEKQLQEAKELQEKQLSLAKIELGSKIANSYIAGEICIEMPKKLVENLLGPAFEGKEQVTKTKTRESYKYGRNGKNQRGNQIYKMEVSFEDGKCSGWKDL